jgi:UDP-N-acetylmuramate dehydrogenase
MGYHTTLRVGGPADLMLLAASEQDVAAGLGWARSREVPVTVLGGGSNVLVSDRGIRGLTIKLSPGLGLIAWQGEHVWAQAGVALARLAAESVRRGLAGLEGCTGIPGSIGGAVIMNAGTAVGCVGDVVTRVQVVDRDGNRAVLDAAGAGFGYRSSKIEPHVVLAVELVLTPGDATELRRTVADLRAMRRTRQPVDQPSAGCVFRNLDQPAALLLDAAGARGRRAGGAEISMRHANFIVTHDGARAADVWVLIQWMQEVVWRTAGRRLELELRLVGDW